MAEHATSTPERVPHPRMAERSSSVEMISAALDRLEDLREYLIAQLDRLEGDPDLEDCCEDEGGACEDEGADTDSEPDETDGGASSMCNWQDEGDQTRLVPHETGWRRWSRLPPVEVL